MLHKLVNVSHGIFALKSKNTSLLRQFQARSVSSLTFRVTSGKGGRGQRGGTGSIVVKSPLTGATFEDLDSYIRQHKDHLTHHDVVAIFLESTKRKVRIGSLSELAVAFHGHAEDYNANALSVMACGLQLYPSSSRGAMQILTAICDRMEGISSNDLSQTRAFKETDIMWSLAECSNVLTGLRRMSSSVHEVRRFLSLIPLHCRPNVSGSKVSAKIMAKGLYGFQSMSSDDVHMRELLVFYNKIFVNGYQDDVDEQTLSHCLFGLQGCTVEHKEVRVMLSSLVNLLNRERTSVPLSLHPRSLGAALLGLRNMSNSYPVVEELLQNVADAAERGIIRAKEQKRLSQGYDVAYTVGSALLGLQGMNSHSPSIQRLLVLLRELLVECDPSNCSELALVNMMYGLQSMSSDIVEVRQLLNVVSCILTQWTKSSPHNKLSLRGVATSLHGLKNMSDSHLEVTRAMRVLREQLVLIPSRHKRGDPEAILNSKVISLSSAVFSNMHSNSAEVRGMIKAQAAVWSSLGIVNSTVNNKKSGKSQLQKTSTVFHWDTQAVANVLHNMRNMSNEHLEVRSMLDVVWSHGLRKVSPTKCNQGKNPRCIFSSVALRDCVYGLRSMTTEFDTPALGKILNSLTDHFHHHLVRKESSESLFNPTMTVADLCVALYGLQGCSSSHKFVRRHVDMSARLLESYTGYEEVDFMTLSKAFLGLQSMSNDSAEIRRMLRTLQQHLSRCIPATSHGNSTISDIGTATAHCLYGLHSMSLFPTHGAEGDDELSGLMSLLHQDFILPFVSTFDVESIQRALYGLTSLINTTSSPNAEAIPHILNILALLTHQLEKIFTEDLHNSPSDHDGDLDKRFNIFREIVPIYQTLNLLSHSLKYLRTQCDSDEKNCAVSLQIDILQASLFGLLQHLKASVPTSDKDSNPSSQTEMMFFNHIERYIKENKKHGIMNVQLSELIDGFSTDIIVRIRHCSPEVSRTSTVNIEIDGPVHKFPRRKRFMALRDAYLKDSQDNFSVVRVDLENSGYRGSKLEVSLHEMMIRVEHAFMGVNE
jgi:hypothetical protein